MIIDSRTTTSVHLSDKLVDVRLSVTEVAALNIVLKLACSPAASGVRKFERPEEVRRLTNEVISMSAQFILWLQQTSLFEIGSDGEDLMHEILDGQDVVLAKSILNDQVIGQRDTLTIDFAIATLVDQLADGLQVRLSDVMMIVNDGVCLLQTTYP